MASEIIDFGGVIKSVYLPADQALQTQDVAYDPISGALKVVISGNLGTTIQYTFALPYSDIQNNTGSFYQLVASTTNEITQVLPYDTTGAATGLYVGSSGNEVLVMNIGPGYDVPTSLVIPAGSRVSIRALGSSAPIAGTFFLQLIG